MRMALCVAFLQQMQLHRRITAKAFPLAAKKALQPNAIYQTSGSIQPPDQVPA